MNQILFVLMMFMPLLGHDDAAQIAADIAAQEAADAAAQPNPAAHQALREQQLSEAEKKSEATNIERLHKASGFTNILYAVASVRKKGERDTAFADLVKFRPSDVRKTYESNPQLLGKFDTDVKK